MTPKLQKRKSSRAAVSTAERGVQTILSEMSEGVVVENDRYEIVYMNRSLVERFGDCVGEKCYRAFIGRRSPCPDCSVKEIIHKGKERFEYTAQDAAGRSYELVATPLYNPDGSVSVIEVIRDVTEKLAARKKIEREKRIAQSITESITHGVMTVDLDGRITSCNPAMRKQLQIPRRQVRGKKIWEVLTPVPAKQWHQAFEHLTHSTEPIRWDRIQIQHNGRREVVNVKIVPLKDETGEVAGSIDVFEFLTDKLSTEKKLKEAKQFYEVLLHDIREIVLVIRHRKVIWCNRRAEEVLGYSRDELLNRTTARLFFSDKEYRAFIQKAYGVLEHADRYSGLLSLRTNKGDRLHIELSLSATSRRGQRVTDVIAVGRDVTERYQVEQEKKERAQRQAILNRISAKIGSSIDLKEVLRYSARSILKLTGLDGCSIVLYDESSQTLKDYASYGLNLNFQKNLKWRLRPGGVTEWVVRNRKILHIPNTLKDTRSIASRATRMAGVKALAAFPILSKRSVIGLIFINSFQTGAFQSEVISLVTSVASQSAVAIENAKLYRKAKRAYQDLKAAQADVVHAGRMAAVGQLAAGIAHELNNPIGGILGYAQFAAGKLQAMRSDSRPNQTYENLRRYLGYIEKESQRCKDIVQKMLNFSRTEPMNYRRVDVSSILTESIQFMEHSLDRAGVTLKKRFSRQLPEIIADGHHLQQVFVNMLINAQKAMNDGGCLTVTTRRKRRSDDDQEMVEIRFTDTGCGIPKEHQDRIFEPFFTTRSIGEGTGLGLSISYRIVKNHGGRISVKSQVGKGTTFIVRLPVHRSQAQIHTISNPTRRSKKDGGAKG
jgi:two-component system NtrC family sensor kinase